MFDSLLKGLKPRSGSGALEFKHYTPRPGDPDWSAVDRKASELVARASESLQFDTGSPAERLAEAGRVARALSTAGSTLIENRRRLKAGDHALLPPYFIWTMHNHCNFRCSYCDNHQGMKYFDLPNKGLLDQTGGDRLLEIMRTRTTGVYFCGGEPTMHKRLPEHVQKAHDLDYFPLMINTNGSLLHKMLPDPRYSRWLKNMDIIIVSLDAMNLDRLAAVWGVDKELCEQVAANITALRRLQDRVGFKLMVNTVITPETVDEADAILDWTADMGIWYSPVPMNVGAGLNPELEGNPGYGALCDKILDRKRKGYKILGSRRLISGLLAADKIKCFPSLVTHIDGDGSMYWPCKTRSEIEPVKLSVLDFDSVDALYAEAQRLVSVNDIHGPGPGRCGADCHWMQNHVADAYARGAANPVTSGVLAEIAEFVGAA